MFHLATHAFFKALLFLGAGSVIHGISDEQNIWKMGRLKEKMPVTYWTFLAATLALVRLPAVERILQQGRHFGGGVGRAARPCSPWASWWLFSPRFTCSAFSSWCFWARRNPILPAPCPRVAQGDDHAADVVVGGRGCSADFLASSNLSRRNSGSRRRRSLRPSNRFKPRRWRRAWAWRLLHRVVAGV